MNHITKQLLISFTASYFILLIVLNVMYGDTLSIGATIAFNVFGGFNAFQIYRLTVSLPKYDKVSRTEKRPLSRNFKAFMIVFVVLFVIFTVWILGVLEL